MVLRARQTERVPCGRLYRVRPLVLFPSIRRILVSGVWVEMKHLHFQSGVGLWGGIKVEKVEKVGFAVHRASFVFFDKQGRCSVESAR